MSKRKAARTTKARSASKIPSKSAGSGQPTGQASSKQAWVLALLCGPSGATIATVTRSTGWQPHTVRAFLAAVVRKKLGLRLESEKTDGERVYRIVAAKASGDATSVPSSCAAGQHTAGRCTASGRFSQSCSRTWIWC
jgi:hypothetical protein